MCLSELWFFQGICPVVGLLGHMDFLDDSVVKKKKKIPLSSRRLGFDPWVRKIPWRRQWKPTPVFLLGKSHGQRSLGGYSSWGHKRVGHDLVMEQQLQLEQCLKSSILTSCVTSGELFSSSVSQCPPCRRKWQPFQHSCLGNLMDRGAWGATVHGVTKSQARLSD